MLRPEVVNMMLVPSTPSLIRVSCDVDVGTEYAQGSATRECWLVDRLPLGCREAVTVTRLSVTIAGNLAFVLNSVVSCGCAVLANNSVENDKIGCDCCHKVDNVSDKLRLGGRS